VSPETRPGAGAGEIEGLSSGRASGVPGALEASMLLLSGAGLGIVLMKSEMASWYRLFEMFRFDSFRLYGVLGSAVASGALGIGALRRLGMRSRQGVPITIPAKAQTPLFARYALGGLLFGVGWGFLGACPGPIFAWLGGGESIYLVPLFSAMMGTWTYGAIRNRLPH